MTNEEAINELRDRYLSISAYADKKQCDKANKAIDMAIQALEKQIPKKVTEDEIIDALECRCCVFRPRCSSCPHQDFCCIARIATDGLNLIRKQQAEIERLKCEMGKLLPKDCSYAVQMEVSNNLETIIRAEAIREFADRLKGMKYESIEWAHGEHPYVVEESDIDNLVEEMAGDK